MNSVYSLRWMRKEIKISTWLGSNIYCLSLAVAVRSDLTFRFWLWFEQLSVQRNVQLSGCQTPAGESASKDEETGRHLLKNFELFVDVQLINFWLIYAHFRWHSWQPIKIWVSPQIFADNLPLSAWARQNSWSSTAKTWKTPKLGLGASCPKSAQKSGRTRSAARHTNAK